MRLVAAAIEQGTVVWGVGNFRGAGAELSALAEAATRAMLTLTLVIGILVSLALAELTGITAGAIIAPGYIALLLDQPQALLGVLIAVVGTHVIVSLVAPWLFLYGTRRLAVSILVGLVLATGLGYAAQRIRLGNADLGGTGLCRPRPHCSPMVPSGFSANRDRAFDRGSAHPGAGADGRRGAAMSWATNIGVRLGLGGRAMGDAASIAVAADRRSRAQPGLLAGGRTPRPRLAAPQQAALVAAARAMLSAQQEIARTKEQMGLLQPVAADPNRTGLIGPDWSEITTTIGDLPAKRTVTNPDLAAMIARILSSLDPAPGAAVGLVLSGSFVGANVAAIAAVEALGLRPVIISSLGASMYGATDPDLTWLDMETVVRRAGIWQARSAAVVLGGESAAAGGLDETGREMLIAAARRNGHAADRRARISAS